MPSVNTVNVVSAIPAEVWEREKPPGLELNFLHTLVPVEADWHVVYGLRTQLKIPNRPGHILFVASEPPEIRRYNLAVLARYRAVLGPGFDYVKNLDNYRFTSGIAPWWVGVTSPTATHYRGIDGSLELDRAAISRLQAPAAEKISVIVSNKARTPLQAQRLRLVEYLSAKISDLEVFGVGHNPIGDKAAALAVSRYHLAVENSLHPGYWTEKLADPILMGCAVFYGGHPSYSNDLPGGGVTVIDPFDPESAYRTIGESLSAGYWAGSAEGIMRNKASLLSTRSFHRVIEKEVMGLSSSGPKRTQTRMPAHHPESRWKKLVDPLYKRL